MNLLMLSRDTAWVGGVVSFVSYLKCGYSKDIVVTDFTIGDRIGRRKLLRRYLQPIIDAIHLFKVMKKNHYDIVHINPSLNTNALLRDGLFMLVLRFFGQHVLVFFHGWEEPLSQRIRNSRIRCFFMRLAFAKSSRILVLANEFRDQLIEMGINGDKISIITTMFNGKQIESVRVAPNISGQKILFLSRFVREKGLFELIEAFTRIAIEFPEARMIMAGDGPAREELVRAIFDAGVTDKIELPGYVHDEEKAAVLANADIFVLPSYSEGCPVSMLEAMAAGQALVSTPVGGIPGILHNGINGVLIDSADPKLIYDALYKLMSSPELLKKISETNKEIAWRCYEAGVITAKIEEYYRKALV